MRRLAAVLVTTALVCGCDGAPSASTAPSSEAEPAVVQGELVQFRRDAEARVVQVRLTAPHAGMVVESVALDGSAFRPAPTWRGTSTLPEGRALDLRLTLTAPDCTATPTDIAARVTVSGRPDPLDVPLEDGGLLAELHEAECAEEALLQQVRIEVVRLDEVRVDGAAALRATVRFTRLSGRDAVRVSGVGPNTVYSVTPARDLPTLAGGGSADLLLDLVPSRCDVHALGESYRTSLLDLRIAVADAEPRVFVFAPAAPVRRRIEQFAIETCRTGGSG